MMPFMSRLRLSLAKVALALVATAAGLLVCELILRLQEPVFHWLDRHYPMAMNTPNPVWGYWAKPNAKVLFTLPEPGYTPREWVYSTNSYGCRYPRDLDVPKPAGVRRIILLGDSFTMGLHFEDTIAARLEQRLNRLGDGTRYEVMNCGTTSYSPLIEYVRFKRQLADLLPDELILNVDLTDVFDDNWRYKPLARFGPDGEPLSLRLPTGQRRRTMRWLGEQSYVIRFLVGLRESLRAGMNPSDPAGRAAIPKNLFIYHFTLPVGSKDWERDVAFCLGNIGWIAQLAKKKGISLMVTTYPHRQQLRPDPGQPLWHREFERRVEQYCRERGIEFFSAFDGIARAFRVGRRLYWDTDMHFTPEGQRTWAGLVGDFYLQHLARQRAALISGKSPHGSAAPAAASRP